MTAPRHDFRPAILRYLAKSPHGRRKAEIINYLGAQDRWNEIDYDLRRLRADGAIHSTSVKWHLSKRAKP